MNPGDKEVADSKDKDKANSEMPEERSYGLWLMENNCGVKAALVANQDISQLTKGGML
jgi:hypothetical protein